MCPQDHRQHLGPDHQDEPAGPQPGHTELRSSSRTSRSARSAASRWPSFITCGLNRASANNVHQFPRAAGMQRVVFHRTGQHLCGRVRILRRRARHVRQCALHRRVAGDDRLPRFAAEIADLGQPAFGCQRQRLRSRRRLDDCVGYRWRGHNGGAARCLRTRTITAAVRISTIRAAVLAARNQKTWSLPPPALATGGRGRHRCRAADRVPSAATAHRRRAARATASEGRSEAPRPGSRRARSAGRASFAVPARPRRRARHTAPQASDVRARGST